MSKGVVHPADVQRSQTPPATDRPKTPRVLDGIICFGGEDWWYHNRGHYDMQMMRELSKSVPVLYVNSIGMRMPQIREGSMFLARVNRKLRSFFHGLKVVRPNFGVFSAISIPKFRDSWIGRRSLAWQVKRAARQMNIRQPLLWIACPPAAEALSLFSQIVSVYQRTDRFEEFPGVNPIQISDYDKQLKDAAELTLFCSSYLYNIEHTHCRNASFIDHGVDYDRFSRAGTNALEPNDVKHIVRPRVGFIGGIDSHTFDPNLFLDVAGRLPDYSFVMVGACSLPKDWCQLPNVYFLGRKVYDAVPDYMASCDVLIMPWNQNEWIRACNPVKLKEYLAIGRPIVSTPFDELKQYDGSVYIANNASDFSNGIRNALTTPYDPNQFRQLVEEETWRSKAEQVVEELRTRNVHFSSS